MNDYKIKLKELISNFTTKFSAKETNLSSLIFLNQIRFFSIF